MGTCGFCGLTKKGISSVLQVCRDCIIHGDWKKIKEHVLRIHEQVRKIEGLPASPPHAIGDEIEIRCNLCLNECSISQNDISYCGLRNPKKNQKSILPYPSRTKGYIHGYMDPNPTNCCNAWFCPAGTSSGYPKYSRIKGPEYGTYSYAAFLYGCTFDCLFCQNASHKHFSKHHHHDVESLASKILENEKTSCICFFGGTPEAQFPFSINLAKKILTSIEEKDKDRIFRICWEWNGSGNRKYVEKCMKIAIKSGGNIKFDLKAFSEKINIALCGISNKRTLENFKFLAENYFGTRSEDMPEMSACTLMVPGYTNNEEVEQIAKFIKNNNFYR